MKKTALLWVFLLSYPSLLHAQNVSIANPYVIENVNDVKIYYFYQGQTMILKNDSDQEFCGKVNIFGNSYGPDQFNCSDLLFVGVDMATKPGEYLLSMESCDVSDSREELRIKILEGDFEKTRTSAYTGIPKTRKDKQKNIVGGAFNSQQLMRDLTVGQSYLKPLEKTDIIDPFGFIYRNNSYRGHYGIDLRVPVGTPVKSTNRGKVILVAKRFRREGNMIILSHGMGIFSVYMHLSKFKVNQGDIVDPGQIIALSGATGAGIREPHLHFNIRVIDTYVDPISFINSVNEHSGR